jgi:hypothetical protein
MIIINKKGVMKITSFYFFYEREEDMTEKEFAKMLINELTKFYPDADIITQKVEKANEEYLGIIIKQDNITPCIDVAPYYEDYNLGHSLEYLVKDFMTTYENFRKPSNIDNDIRNKLENWDWVKDRLYPVLINSERNARFVVENDILFQHFEADLLVIYKIRVIDDGDTTGNITIKKAFLSLWNVTEEMIFDAANKSPISKPEIMDMATMMNEMCGEYFAEPYSIPMVIISNVAKKEGAAAILQKDVLDNAAKMLRTNKIYLLPSSIHEWIATDITMDPNELTNIVESVNVDVVSDEDFLSDNVFSYNTATKEFTVTEKKEY